MNNCLHSLLPWVSGSGMHRNQLLLIVTTPIRRPYQAHGRFLDAHHSYRPPRNYLTSDTPIAHFKSVTPCPRQLAEQELRGAIRRVSVSRMQHSLNQSYSPSQPLLMTKVILDAVEGRLLAQIGLSRRNLPARASSGGSQMRALPTALPFSTLFCAMEACRPSFMCKRWRTLWTPASSGRWSGKSL
jgi:hypothetical protein